ncbi:hypothetical protein BDY24DRAFT_371247 [Mrakia frigida]|uniref:uncharacterized protein n=1 Tax=Mrakia frigida TaxID=29902 RepID=UPI003FCC0753
MSLISFFSICSRSRRRGKSVPSSIASDKDPRRTDRAGGAGGGGGSGPIEPEDGRQQQHAHVRETTRPPSFVAQWVLEAHRRVERTEGGCKDDGWVWDYEREFAVLFQITDLSFLSNSSRPSVPPVLTDVPPSSSLQNDSYIDHAARTPPPSQGSSYTTTTGVAVDEGRSRRVVDQDVLISAAATLDGSSVRVFDDESMLDEDQLFGDEELPVGGSGSRGGAGVWGGRSGREQLVAACLDLQELVKIAKEEDSTVDQSLLRGEDPTSSSSSHIPLVNVLDQGEGGPSTYTSPSSSSSPSSFDDNRPRPGTAAATTVAPTITPSLLSAIETEEGGGSEPDAHELVPIEWSGRGAPASGRPSPSSSRLVPPSSSSLLLSPPLDTTTEPASSFALVFVSPGLESSPTPTATQPSRPRPRGIILQSPGNPSPSPPPPPTAPLRPVPPTGTEQQPLVGPLTEQTTSRARTKGRGQVRRDTAFLSLFSLVNVNGYTFFVNDLCRSG